VKLAGTKPAEDGRGKMRLYEYGDASVPSVTTVISGIESDSWLEAWRKKVGAQKADMIRVDAAAFGTRVHALIAGEQIDSPDELEIKCATGAIDWLYKHTDEILETELKMADLDLGFGGTVDVIARMTNGAIAVIDWKTSKRLSPAHNLQTAGYALLARAAGYDVQERYVVRLWKDPEDAGRVSTRKCANVADFDAFKAAVTIWHWRHPGAAKIDP
jgi:hypothetical protein